MGLIEVWAPNAARVDVEIGGARRRLEKRPAGWWRSETNLARHGVDYAFFLDGDGPLPDPRSAWQPFGIDPPSRLLDHALFPWTDRGWQPGPLSAAIVYELHVGTFSAEGTCDGVQKKLDHLLSLGVTHVELMPVSTFSGRRGWGYDGVDLYAPHEAYGGPDGLKRLVDACHARGLAVILDVVYNHLGPVGNYLARFGPYFTKRYASPWGEAVNFDGPGSDEVRRFVIDNARLWLADYHIDALRLDAVHAIFDASALHILEELAQETEALSARLGRRKYLIAESDLNDPRLVRRREVGGYGIDAQWSDDFHHALHAFLTGERAGYYRDFGSLADLSHALQHAFVYEGQFSPHRGRRHGRSTAGLPGRRFLGFLQNHDQVGNRARGERSSQLLSDGKLRIGAALVLTAPFMPLLFMGEEWGASTPFRYFTDHQDPALGDAVREGRRREFAAFGWRAEDIPDPQAVETFERSRLNWSELAEQPHAALLDWTRRLIRLRKEEPALADGRLDRVHVAWSETNGWLVLTRGPIEVVCNFRADAQRVPLPANGQRISLLASAADAEIDESAIRLPGESVAVVRGL
jgi:maltooligosyltrehalose trehalohydrolase